MHYRLNTANVVHDVIDGEALAIRSDNGAYYSMTGSAATVWAAAVADRSVDDIVTAVAEHHGIDAGDIQADVATFLEQVIAEDLLITSDAPGPGAEQDLELPAETSGTPWSTPSAEKFSDMQDLLMFDPIHEVKSEGWPQVDPAAAGRPAPPSTPDAPTS